MLICVAQLMVVLDGTIANIALPYIGTDLDISEANLSWVVTGYALAFGGLLLLGGRLGDLYGRRRIFMVGLAVFAVASPLGGLARTRPCCSSSRGLQGLGAALASPAALALITTTFPAGPQRNRAFAVYAAMSGAGAAVGLILGGWLTGSTRPARTRGLAPDLPHQHADRPGRGGARPDAAGRVRPPRRPARHPGRRHRHPGPARARLRPHPDRPDARPALRLGRPAGRSPPAARGRPARASSC